MLVLSITHRLIFGVLLNSNTCSFGKCLLSVDHGPRQSSVSSLGGKRSGLEVINDYSGFFVRPTSHRSGASVLLVPLAGCPFSLHPPSLCSCTSCSLFFLVMRGRRRIWGASTHLAASAAACCIHRKEGKEGREGETEEVPLLRNKYQRCRRKESKGLGTSQLLYVFPDSSMPWAFPMALDSLLSCFLACLAQN